MTDRSGKKPSLAKSRKSKPTPELTGNALIRAVVAAISDEGLRHIAESKDISTCRSRILAAAVIAHASLSQGSAAAGPSSSSPSGL